MPQDKLDRVGLPQLIRNKEACARPKDQDDLKFLRQLAP